MIPNRILSERTRSRTAAEIPRRVGHPLVMGDGNQVAVGHGQTETQSGGFEKDEVLEIVDEAETRLRQADLTADEREEALADLATIRTQAGEEGAKRRRDEGSPTCPTRAHADRRLGREAARTHPVAPLLGGQQCQQCVNQRAQRAATEAAVMLLELAQRRVGATRRGGSRSPYKQEVGGSIPSPPIEEGPGNRAFLVPVVLQSQGPGR